MTTDRKALVVDPIPVKGGIINGGHRLTFDAKQRPVIVYHKLDAKGHMQIFVARFEGGEWKRHAVTDWDKPIHFRGRGAMPFIGIRIGGVKRVDAATHAISYRHRDHGSGSIAVDDATLRPVDRKVVVPRDIPGEVYKRTIDFDGIGVKVARDLGTSGDANVRYLLRWETLGPNHDRPRRPPLPPASMLALVRLER